MVTSNKSLENKAVTMSETSAASGGPPRTLLGEVNPHLSCVLCRGYYIDATTIVECLHSFCRSCIIKHLKTKSYCPVCEMMINSARPNIKPDKALQDIVYKLVPGLFQKEMERRQQFYASNPATAASATPEQRGDDRERLIFSPEDVISFSLEYVDSTEMESTSSKSSESGSDSSNTAGKGTRRFLQCPAVVNISHLKKFLSNKLDVDLSQFCIDILYKNLTLPDYYTLMDVAYIYNWKKIEPMRFFYQIIDFAALRNRFGLFGMNRPAHLRKRKLGPNSGIVTLGHPLHNLLDPTSDASSGGNSPLPEEAASPPVLEISHQLDTESDNTKVMRDGRLRSSKILESDRPAPSTSKSAAPPQPDEEKSQFLNSFELTAKSKLSPSPVKNPSSISTTSPNNSKGETKSNSSPQSKSESPAKRKLTLEIDANEMKKSKMESPTKKEVKPASIPPKRNEDKLSSSFPSKPIVATETKETKPSNKGQTVSIPVKDSPPAQHNSPKVIPKTSQKMSEEKLASINEQIMAQRRQISAAINANQLAKSKLASEGNSQHFAVKPSPSTTQKPSTPSLKPNDKPTTHLPKKPEFKPSISTSNEMQMKSHTPTNKPAPKQETTADIKTDPKSGNNSRPSLKTMLSAPAQTSGDPLKSLFDSCNINIPSSLSITLSDQKIEQKPPEQPTAEQKNKPHKPLPSTSMSSAFNNPVKTPSPPVHNYIEIVKLPEVENSKPPNKTDNTKPPGAPSNNKSGDTPPVSSAKGPVPNLKPISSTKGGKTVTFAKPQTFQQTFLQSLEKQNDKKVIKTKLPPGLKPAPGTSPGPETEPSPVAVPPNLNPPKTPMLSPSGPVTVEKPKLLPNLLKTDSALDLSTPHIPLNHTLQHTKALETMQSIANLAKKQNCLPHRNTLPTQSFSQNNAKNSQIHLRIPVPTNQPKPPLSSSPLLHPSTNSPRHLPEYYHPLKGPGRGNSSPVQSAKASAPLIPTRSPSSSPKLVIACPSPKSHSPEDKQLVSPKISENTSQSNQISSSQITSTNATGAELSKEPQKPAKHSGSAPGPSSKLSSVRLTTPKSSGELHHNLPQQVLAQQAFMRQLDYQNQINLLHGASAQWLQMSNNNMARAHFENFVKNMAHNGQNPYGNLHKDKP